MKVKNQEDSYRKQRLKLRTIRDLSRCLGVPEGDLSRLVEKLDTRWGKRALYRSWDEPKKSGGTRRIDAPTKEWRWVLQRINRRILQRLYIDSTAKGGIQGKSLIDNVLPHVGKPMIAKFDLQDFFPSIASGRVYDLFCKIGCVPDVARVLTRLTTVDGKLPQGSPTSSMLAVLVTGYGGKQSFNGRLRRLASQHKSLCTTWVDDVTISGPRYLARLQGTVEKIAKQYRLKLNQNKNAFLSQQEQQVVTGVVVNSKPSVSRRERRQIRTILYQCQKRGLRAVEIREGPKLRERLLGKILYVQGINAEQGKPLMALFQSIDWSK